MLPRIHSASPVEVSPLRSKYQFGVVRVSTTSGCLSCRTLKRRCVDAMSDSPPDRDLATQRRPTMSDPSVWKYWLAGVSFCGEG